MQETTKIWNATLYLRLSRDDGDKEESNSITGQRELLRDFLANHSDIREYTIRVDDGWSGSTFERPGFQKMMEDVKAGRTNCIVVKDLSRFGRNYLDAGEYIEKIFPFLGVRFIAVNDNYDSLGGKKSSDDLIIPFKNLINEAYCRDISVKIRTQLEIKRKKGQYLGSFATYGYLKDEQDKNKLVVDEFAADIVRDMFQWKLEGVSPQDIANTLNRLGVLSPMEYKRSLGMKFTTPFKTNPKAVWSAATVIRILKNPVYTGVLIQGKATTPSYKVHKRVTKAESEWCVIENNHEAIVSQMLFDNVQKVLRLDTRRSPEDEAVTLFSGMVFCGDCGASMVRKTVPAGGRKYVYYVCSANKQDSTDERITEAGLANSSTNVQPAGTIMLAMIGEGKTRGQAAILEISAAHNQNTAAILVSATPCDPKYIYYFLQMNYENTRRVGSGNNQKALNKERVRALRFPFTSFAEQHVIVEAIESRLSVCDSIEQTVDIALQQAEAMRQSILKDAFEGRL